MGIITSIKSAWKSSTTAEKIHLCIDILCGFGAGAVSSKISKELTPGMGRFQRACVNLTMCGLGMAAGDCASNAFAPYCEALGGMIDKKKNKSEEGTKSE